MISMIFAVFTGFLAGWVAHWLWWPYLKAKTLLFLEGPSSPPLCQCCRRETSESEILLYGGTCAICAIYDAG